MSNDSRFDSLAAWTFFFGMLATVSFVFIMIMVFTLPSSKKMINLDDCKTIQVEDQLYKDCSRIVYNP